MKADHDPLRFAAREYLRRHLTTVLDAVDMPEPTRTAVVSELLGHADVHCEDRPEPDGAGLRLVHTAVLTIAAPYPVRVAEVAEAPRPAERLGGLTGSAPFPVDLDVLPIDDPLVTALSERINAKSWLIMPRTIGGVVAALRELRPAGGCDPADEALAAAVACRIGFPGHGKTRLSIIRRVIEALNAETAGVAS